MHLKNKKTGEIVEPFGITCINGRTFVQFDDGKGTFKFEAHSLAELNEEWEDYEEPKRYWCINEFGNIVEVVGEPSKETIYDKSRKNLGNYFETKEEAEKAVEKLKAWNRLKKGGFRFMSWDSEIEGEDHFDCCGMVFITGSFEEGGKCKKDLDLLFGDEE